MKKIKLLIVDDHLIIRDGIKMMLKKELDFEVVAEANNGKEAIEYLGNNKELIDVVLMDISMPEMNGIDATQIITDNYNDIEVLALTMHVGEANIIDMLKAGARGYILKESGTGELIVAIKNVYNKKNHYSTQVSVTMINALMNGTNLKPLKSSKLSNREIEVLNLICEGLTSKEVGGILNISGRTVETHRRNILAKLELKNTAEMIRYSIEHKLEAKTI
jgi:two-component system nitrate/nitrite response regulator NarL